MLPLKIASLLNNPPLPKAPVAPLRPRLAAAESPLAAPEPVGPPEHERRSMGDRRVAERRENEQAAFLDTRIAQSRRRNDGRRADDQQRRQQRVAISVKA